MPVDATVDHLVVAGRRLEQLREAVTGAGFRPTYGGEHDNGVTHNAVIGLEDESYVELISTIDPGDESPWWDLEIRETSGPAAWALSVDDIDRETARLADAGFAVDGPTRYAREKPDGKRIEWDLTVVGDRMGVPFPFLIEDRTPRDARVPDPVPATDPAGPPPVTGIEAVLVGVADLECWIDPVRDLFRCGSPDRAFVPELAAEVAAFADAPLALVAPDGPGPVARRVETFDRRPIGCLFSRHDEATVPEAATPASIDWFGSRVTWLPIDLPGYVGVLEP